MGTDKMYKTFFKLVISIAFDFFFFNQKKNCDDTIPNVFAKSAQAIRWSDWN